MHGSASIKISDWRTRLKHAEHTLTNRITPPNTRTRAPPPPTHPKHFHASVVNISNTAVTDAGVKALVTMCPLLVELDISSCAHVSQDIAGIIAEFGPNLKMVSFDALSDRMTNESITALAAPPIEAEDVASMVSTAAGRGGTASERVQDLRVKELKKIIDDAGLSHADCFEKPELRRRAVEALEMGVAKCNHWTSLVGCTKLTTISLSGTSVDDIGLATLSLGCPSLTTVDLNFTNITDFGLKDLANNLKLEVVSLGGCNTKKDGSTQTYHEPNSNGGFDRSELTQMSFNLGGGTKQETPSEGQPAKSSGTWGEDVWGKIGANPELKEYLADPTYIEAVQEMQSDHALYMGREGGPDPRILETLMFLMMGINPSQMPGGAPLFVTVGETAEEKEDAKAKKAKEAAAAAEHKAVSRYAAEAKAEDGMVGCHDTITGKQDDCGRIKSINDLNEQTHELRQNTLSPTESLLPTDIGISFLATSCASSLKIITLEGTHILPPCSPR